MAQFEHRLLQRAPAHGTRRQAVRLALAQQRQAHHQRLHQHHGAVDDDAEVHRAQ